MATAPLSATSATEVQKLIDGATADPNKVPGVVFATANKDGQTIFAHASGKRGVESNEAMTLDSVFWIASFTKLVTAVAVLQLVEQGKLALDDADLAEKLCPEFKDMKIVKGFDDKDRPVFIEKKNRITLRMCLSHTVGFGYSFFNHTVRRYGYPAGLDEFDGTEESYTSSPLLFEPGTRWEYSIGLDWAGIMIMRLTSQSLESYFQSHIFKPLGLTDISFFPTPSMLSRLAYMNQKLRPDKILPLDHLQHRPLTVSPDKQHTVFNSGGAGLFAKPTEYLKLLTAVLNHGTSPSTHASILSPSSVDLLFTPQDIPNKDFSRTPLPDAKPHLTNWLPEHYPQPHELEQGWSFAGLCTIHPTAAGRGREGVQWAGLANGFWWVDRTRGVVGLIASQILPFGDPDVGMLWVQAEKAVYDALDKEKEGGK